MSKVRFSISIDETQAALIKSTANAAGQDVSAFMGKAAMEAVERRRCFADALAEIDERIDAVPDIAPWPPRPVDGELSPMEQNRIAAKWGSLLGAAKRDAA